MVVNSYFGLNSGGALGGFYKALLRELGVEQSPSECEIQGKVADPSKDLMAMEIEDEKAANKRTIIFGSGFKSPFDKLAEDSHLDLLAVRGYLTLNRLGPTAERLFTIGDPALLAADLIEESGRGGAGVGIILNSRTYEDDINRRFPHSFESSFISLAMVDEIGLKQTLERIAKSDFIVSDSVVGLAIADALQIPNVWLDRGQAGSTKFEVMDYFSSVSRNVSATISELPRTVSALAKKTRLASSHEVGERVLALRNRLDEVRDLLMSEPVELLPEPVNIEHEHPVAFPARGGRMILELDIESGGLIQEKQYLISFDLITRNGKDLKPHDKIPGFYLSADPNIGHYNYLKLNTENECITVVVNIPEPLECVGFKVRKWAKNAPVMMINRLRILQ